jgi:hypothetical protein
MKTARFPQESGCFHYISITVLISPKRRAAAKIKMKNFLYMISTSFILGVDCIHFSINKTE